MNDRTIMKSTLRTPKDEESLEDNMVEVSDDTRLLDQKVHTECAKQYTEKTRSQYPLPKVPTTKIPIARPLYEIRDPGRG